MGEEIATSAARPSPPRARAVWAVVGTVAALVVAGCGDDEQRQDATEPEGEFPVEVLSAKFPTEQRLAQTSDLQLELENAGDEEIPDLAVTINTGDGNASGPFSIHSDQPGLADPNRPVWILEHNYPKLLAPGDRLRDLESAPSAGAEAAQTNTFAFGPVEPGETKDIVWRVTPVQAGTYTVRYEIAAGLTGKAQAVTADGSPVEGEFVVTISNKPPQARVNDQGEVVVED